MTALLRAELIKLRTTRTFGALAGAAVATSVIIAGLVALLTEPTKDSVLVDVFASDTSSFFILMLGVVGISGEWRHRTITSSLLAAPKRLRFLAAKTIAFATAGVVLSMITAIAVTVVGATVLFVRDLPLVDAADLAGQAGRNALLAALLGAFGVTIGALLRNQRCGRDVAGGVVRSRARDHCSGAAGGPVRPARGPSRRRGRAAPRRRGDGGSRTARGCRRRGPDDPVDRGGVRRSGNTAPAPRPGMSPFPRLDGKTRDSRLRVEPSPRPTPGPHRIS